MLWWLHAEPSDDAIKRTLDYLHDRAKGATYFTASDPDTVRPMLELIWAPLLGAFSLLFDEYSDPRLLAICLAGFEAATCLAAQLGVAQLRDVFVNSLCNFTHLHTPRWVMSCIMVVRAARHVRDVDLCRRQSWQCSAKCWLTATDLPCRRQCWI